MIVGQNKLKWVRRGFYNPSNETKAQKRLRTENKRNKKHKKSRKNG